MESIELRSDQLNYAYDVMSATAKSYIVLIVLVRFFWMFNFIWIFLYSFMTFYNMFPTYLHMSVSVSLGRFSHRKQMTFLCTNTVGSAGDLQTLIRWNFLNILHTVKYCKIVSYKNCCDDSYSSKTNIDTWRRSIVIYMQNCQRSDCKWVERCAKRSSSCYDSRFYTFTRRNSRFRR